MDRKKIMAHSFAILLFALFSIVGSDQYFEHRKSVKSLVAPVSLSGSISTATGAIASSGALASSADVQSPSRETEETVFFWPDPEIRQKFTRLIGSAKNELNFSVYLLTDEEVVVALIAASKRGVSVKGIVEKNVYRIPNANRKSRDRLLSAGADIRYADKDGFSYSHAKYLISDGNSYVFSTGNYSKSTFTKNRELFAFGNDAEMSRFLSSVFLADFSGIRTQIAVPDRAYLAPQNARGRLSEFLSGTGGDVYIFAPSISDDATVSQLNRLSESGRRIFLCLSELPNPGTFVPEIRAVASSGPTVHAKTLYKKKEALFYGSANLTQNSLDRNREIGVVSKNPKLFSDYENMLKRDCKW